MCHCVSASGYRQQLALERRLPAPANRHSRPAVIIHVAAEFQAGQRADLTLSRGCCPYCEGAWQLASNSNGSPSRRRDAMNWADARSARTRPMRKLRSVPGSMSEQIRRVHAWRAQNTPCSAECRLRNRACWTCCEATAAAEAAPRLTQ